MLTELETPPPGAGLKTVIGHDPFLQSVIGSTAVSFLLETKVVILFNPLNLTTEVVLKPVPLTVKVKGTLLHPTCAIVGDILDMNGTGFILLLLKLIVLFMLL